MDRKKVLDVQDVNSEFQKLQERFKILESRLYAVALDYKHYIDNSMSNDRLYELRDNVIYRLFSSRFHIQLLLQQQIEIKDKCFKMMNDGNWDLIQGIHPVHPLHDHFKKEVSSIFDSLLYHIVSTFDFISSLVNYIYAPKNEKQNSIMWTTLAKIARDKQNLLFPISISNAIKDYDNHFVSKLYDYRSHIIHDKGDLNQFTYNVTMGSQFSLAIGFIATQKFTNNFSELKKMYKDVALSTSYVSFWLLNKSIDYITDLLFDIKKNLEEIENPPGGMFYIPDPNSNKMLSVSVAYWYEEEYIKSKNV